RPGGSMADHRFVAEAFDLALAHAAEIVPRLVVFAGVDEAEPDVLVQAFARFRNAIESLGAAARARAHAHLFCRDSGLRTIRLDPDLLLEFLPRGLLVHSRIMGLNGKKTRK